MAAKGAIPEYALPGIPSGKQPKFNPYAENGGSIVAIAGADYAIIGADTRLSTGFSIYTREQKKLFLLSDSTVLGATGCWCDTITLTRLVRARMQMYLYEYNKPMSTPAVAQMLCTMLYYKRFFPYNVSNVIAGLDDEGKGCVFSYDAIGHYERSQFRAGGSAGALMQPLLDNQIGFKNMQNVTETLASKDKAVAILKDVFISGSERDIYTGDSIYVTVITAKGVEEETFALRKD